MEPETVEPETVEPETGSGRSEAAMGGLRALRDRYRRVPAVAADGALGAVFLAGMLIERTGAGLARDRVPLAAVLSVLVAAGLALRRRAPVTGYLLGSAALSVEALFVEPSPVSPYANLIGLYSLGLHADRRHAWFAPPLVVAGVAAYFAGLGSSSLLAPAGVLFSWLLAWALGYSTARRREAQQASEHLRRHQAIVEERARIARELHDLIGHTVNLMVVQAGAARRVLDRDPAQSRELLSSVESTGRDALGELDRVLGILRQDGRTGADAAGTPDAAIDTGPAAGLPVAAGIPEAAALPDAAGLPHLPDLVRRMGHAGIRVTIEVDGELDGDPASRSMSLTAYRIIQEALTNALKHGQAGSANVSVRHAGGALEVEVRDDGRGAPDGYVPGRGLVGIRERVALFGGSLEHGGGDRGGFRVRAVLPLP